MIKRTPDGGSPRHARHHHPQSAPGHVGTFDWFAAQGLAAAAALGAGLVFLRLASYGPRTWWDSVNYVTVARNLLAGDGLVGLGSGPWVSWPPLYPAMLAGGGLFGFDPYAVAGPLNAVIFGLTVLVAGWWLRRHLRSRFLWLWGCLSTALALPLAEVASDALSESAFILFVVLSLTQIDAHLGGGGRASLVRAAAFSALACLTRYMGVSVILAVVPMLLAARVAPREKMKRIVVYTLIAAAPVGLWMLRNFLLAGSTTGERDLGFYSFPFIVDEALRIAFGHWWLVGLTAPALLALVMAACHAFCRRSDWKRDAAVASDVAWGPLRVFGGFALAYLTLLVAAMMSGGTWDGLQWRYLAPVYVPLLFAALLLMDGALQYARKRAPRGIVPRWRGVPAIGGRKALAAVLMLALCLQTAGLVVLQEREIRRWNAGVRQGYGAPRWRNSESVQYIREAALAGAILSNDMSVTSLYAYGPARHYGLECKPDRLWSALWNKRVSGEVHVLYFRDWRGGCSRQQDEDLRSALSREPWLELVAELADGTLYRLRERELPPAMFHGLPVRHYALPCEPGHLSSALSDALGSGEVHVLYFRDRRRECSRQQDEDLRSALSREPWLELVAALADGTLYRLRGRELPPAMFHSSDAPVEGKSFGAFLNKSHGRRLPEPWRWEKDGDADGWTSLPVQRPTYAYIPTVADVGHRLRASVYYADPLDNRVKAITEPSEPVRADASEADRIIRSRYDVYRRGNRLIYENRSCSWEDEFGTRFPLLVYSLGAESGTPERGTLDFEWRKNSWRNNGTCVMERRLPDKDIAGIRTGQVDREGNPLWEAEHWFEESRQWLDGHLSSATSGEPAARSVFDIYLGKGNLIFVKDPCAHADTEAMFFLHVIPIDPDDLPDHRKQYGFDNLDFDFAKRGTIFGDICLAKVPLPEYGISGIRTGQYVPGQGRVWKEEFPFNAAE